MCLYFLFELQRLGQKSFKNCLLFGRFEAKKNCFRDYLTFTPGVLPKFKFHKMRLGEIFRPYLKRSLPRYCTKAYCRSSSISIELISPSYSSPLDFQILRQNIPAFQGSLVFFKGFLAFFSSVMTVEAPSIEKM